MNIILFSKEECSDGRLLLRDHRARHVVKVLRSRVGDRLRLGEIDGSVGTGELLRIQTRYPFEVELEIKLNKEPQAPPSIDLLLALPRPIMLKRILSQVTALGVGTIYLINANRVEKSFWDSGILGEEEYRPHLLHGLEQAVDTRLPSIECHPGFRPFIEDYLPKKSKDYGSLILAHPGGGKRLQHCVSEGSGRVLYGIGPEGGWVDFEVEKFLDAGFKPFSIGSRILKVDTAVVAIHGMIQAVTEKGRV